MVARIERAIDAVGAPPLNPVFERLDGEVDYDRIHIVAICRHNREEAAAPSANQATRKGASSSGHAGGEPG